MEVVAINRQGVDGNNEVDEPTALQVVQVAPKLVERHTLPFPRVVDPRTGFVWLATAYIKRPDDDMTIPRQF